MSSRRNFTQYLIRQYGIAGSTIIEVAKGYSVDDTDGRPTPKPQSLDQQRS